MVIWWFSNSITIWAEGQGTIELPLWSPSGQINYLTLHNILYIPSASLNIMSGSRALWNSFTFSGGADCIKIITPAKKLIELAVLKQNHFVLEMEATPELNAIYIGTTSPPINIETTHIWLGHVVYSTLKSMLKAGQVKGINVDTSSATYENPPFCHDCARGKMTKNSFPTSASRANEPLGLIHSDVAGPLTPASLGGYRYLVTYTDDFSGMSWVYALKSKSDQFETFKNFRAEIELQTGHKIKIFCTDRGGEFLGDAHSAYLRENGIVHQTTAPGTPQQNGVAERLNHTLGDKVRTLFAQSGLPTFLWPYAYQHACFLKNIAPTRHNFDGLMPWQKFFDCPWCLYASRFRGTCVCTGAWGQALL